MVEPARDRDHEPEVGLDDRVTLGIGPRGTSVGPLGRERVRKDWLRRVHAANLAAADARNAFVKANLRLVVSIARRF
ncbi:MAG TPA: hypothetical protein VK601_31450, partial [Kofleriaceae bacterium]|nr:hypothetical protein [Kofleriaceae bacterium]